MASYDVELHEGARITFVIIMLFLFTLNVNFYINILMFHDINQTNDFLFLAKKIDKVLRYFA